MTAPSRPRTRWRFALTIAAAGGLLVGVVVLAFVWPAATATARDVPVGISGPSAQTAALRSELATRSSGPFHLVVVDSRTDAVHGIRHRELYGAILLGDAPEVLTASAASTASNQALRGVAAQLQAQISASVERGLVAQLQQVAAGRPSAGAAPSAPPTVKVTDVVALADSDPTGAGLAAASFPLVLGGMLGGVLVSLLVAGSIRRLAGLVVYGVVSGAAVTLVLQTWLGVLQGPWPANAAAFGLAMTATAAIVVGLNALLGRAGIPIGAVISLLVGNPISGAALPYQFIAGPWGAVGLDFVPGAASTLVRSLSYFPDADTTRQWIVLGAWALAGLVLTVAGHFRSVAPVPLPAAELEPDAARAAGHPVPRFGHPAHRAG